LPPLPAVFSRKFLGDGKRTLTNYMLFLAAAGAQTVMEETAEAVRTPGIRFDAVEHVVTFGWSTDAGSNRCHRRR